MHADSLGSRSHVARTRDSEHAVLGRLSGRSASPLVHEHRVLVRTPREWHVMHRIASSPLWARRHQKPNPRHIRGQRHRRRRHPSRSSRRTASLGNDGQYRVVGAQQGQLGYVWGASLGVFPHRGPLEERPSMCRSPEGAGFRGRSRLGRGRVWSSSFGCSATETGAVGGNSSEACEASGGQMIGRPNTRTLTCVCVCRPT